MIFFQLLGMIIWAFGYAAFLGRAKEKSTHGQHMSAATAVGRHIGSALPQPVAAETRPAHACVFLSHLLGMSVYGLIINVAGGGGQLRRAT